MKRTLGILAIVVSLCAFPIASGVAAKTKIVTYAEKEGMDVPAAGPAESLIVFLRATNFGGAVAATVYERGDDGSLTLITASYAKTYMVHTVAPGKHVFAVVSEAADFIEVNAAPGKIYPIMVTPRMGAWKARFGLASASPGTEFWGKVKGWLEGSFRTTPNEAGPRWFEDHRPFVMEKIGDYWPKWLAKPDQPIVKAEDGVTAF